MISIVLKKQQGFELPFNGDDRLLRCFRDINNRWNPYPITSVFMTDHRLATSPAYPAYASAAKNRPRRDFAEEFHDYGIRLKYVLNESTLLLQRSAFEIRDEALRLVEQLVEAGFDAVSVASRTLATAIHERFPEIRLSTTAGNHLNSCERVRRLFSTAPYDTIMLDSRHGRDFPLMRRLREEFPQYELTSVANESLLLDSLSPRYQDLWGKLSNCGDLAEEMMDFLLCEAAKRRLEEPSLVLKAPFVPPDDVHELFKAGVTTVQLACRSMDSMWIERLADIYTSGRFTGYDVYPLVEQSAPTVSGRDRTLRRKLASCRCAVDNAALKGFLRPFIEGKTPCLRRRGDCANCSYCASWTAKAVMRPCNHHQLLYAIEASERRLLRPSGNRSDQGNRRDQKERLVPAAA